MVLYYNSPSKQLCRSNGNGKLSSRSPLESEAKALGVGQEDERQIKTTGWQFELGCFLGGADIWNAAEEEAALFCSHGTHVSLTSIQAWCLLQGKIVYCSKIHIGLCPRQHIGSAKWLLVLKIAFLGACFHSFYQEIYICIPSSRGIAERWGKRKQCGCLKKIHIFKPLKKQRKTCLIGCVSLVRPAIWCKRGVRKITKPPKNHRVRENPPVICNTEPHLKSCCLFPGPIVLQSPC